MSSLPHNDQGFGLGRRQDMARVQNVSFAPAPQARLYQIFLSACALAGIAATFDVLNIGNVDYESEIIAHRT